MKPLEVRAHLDTGLMLPQGWLALDSLLMAAVAQRDNLPRPSVLTGPLPMLEIPVLFDEAHGFHFASVAVAKWEQHETRHINRRFPADEAARLGDGKLKKISLSSGPTKSYRIPARVGWVAGDVLTWWCIGHEDQVRELLRVVSYLGKRRAVGCGRVRRWEVEVMRETWEGFPVTRDGQPLRPLPTTWGDLATAFPRAMGCLRPPYWERYREEEIAVPWVE